MPVLHLQLPECLEMGRPCNLAHGQQGTSSWQRLPGKPPSSRSPRRCSLPSPFTRALCALSACTAQFTSLWYMNFMPWIAWTRAGIDTGFSANLTDVCPWVQSAGWFLYALLTRYRHGTRNKSGSKALLVLRRGQSWQQFLTERLLQQ